MHTVLWIGGAEGLGQSPLAGAPTLDVTWTPDLEGALDLSLPSFELVVVDAAAGEGKLATARLRRAGARDVWVTADPARSPGVGELAARLSRRRRTRRPEAAAPPGVIGRSPAMKETFALVERACRTSATVLLSGETGTGKEVLARAIHAGSARSAGPFVPVNCAAFPDTLLESELFGHVRGAFTGADRPKQGLFEVADGGTLFLDEVGETSGTLQAKLLRALQEREVRPVGGNRARRVDARVIAATNRELSAEVRAARFREDLYYRLAVFPIPVPPLRERREDILPLAEHFLELHGVREGTPGCRFSKDAASWLLAHRWPGNVRELENEVQRALALSEPGDEIPPAHLSHRVGEWVAPTESLVRDGEPLRESLSRLEAYLLRRALDARGGRRAETARALGLTREGLYKKMKRLGID